MRGFSKLHTQTLTHTDRNTHTNTHTHTLTHTQARKALRSMYLRRALSGWYERVLHLAQTRYKLHSAAQVRVGVGL
jgi:hypothetical protein